MTFKPGTYRIDELITAGLMEIGDGYRAKNSELSKEGIPFARAANINDGFKFNDAGMFPIAAISKVGNKVSRPGDVVFTSKGTVGRFALVSQQTPIFVYSPQLCFWRSLAPEKLLADFLYYWMNSAEFLNQISYLKGQTDMADYVSLRDQRRITATIPDTTTQRLIVSVIKPLDNRIVLLRETNATLEAIAQALFKSWFVDFDPVHAKQEGRAPEGIGEATAALFPDGFEESHNMHVPRGWYLSDMDCWMSVLETGRRPKGGVSGIEKGIPSIGAESISRIGRFDFSKTKYVTQEFFEKMKSGALESHDVLLYKDGGKPGVFLPRISMFGNGFPFETCGINEHVFRIRLKPPFNQAFLYFWLWSDAVMHDLKHRGGKAAIPGINQADVKAQHLLVPSSSVLQKFDELSAPLISLIFDNAKRIQTLSLLRDTLLPRLISGQLRLSEAEAFVA